MKQQELLTILSKVLAVDEEVLSVKSNLEELGWDSLSSLAFISELDERHGVRVSADDLAVAKTIDDLLQITQRI